MARASAEVAQQQPSPAAPSALGTQQGPLRLIDVSLDVMAAFGVSTERDASLSVLQGGGHDPNQRGFSLQQAELSLAGAVDPWFTARAYLVAFLDAESGETAVELEEAYLTTQQLPADLQLKAGTFLTEFGRINPSHPHAWDWQNQPVIHTRLFGADGMRGPGARLAWLVPTETFAELTFGVQNADGETMTSFLANDEVYEERPIGGRFFTEQETRSGADFVYTARFSTAFDLGDTQGLGLGASAAFGPNATGGGADTLIYGVDFAWRWQPEEGGRNAAFVKVQGELLGRAFDAVAQTDDADPSDPVALPATTLDDYGGYLQGLCGFAPGWAAGVRVEWASGDGDSYDVATQSFGRAGDPYRTDRLRVSPLLAWKPSEFSRIRLQYDYDDSDHLGDEAHSLWLGFEVLVGAHPPHTY